MHFRCVLIGAFHSGREDFKQSVQNEGYTYSNRCILKYKNEKINFNAQYMRCHFGCVHCLLQSHKRFSAVFASLFVKFKVLTVRKPYVMVLAFRIFIINLKITLPY